MSSFCGTGDDFQDAGQETTEKQASVMRDMRDFYLFMLRYLYKLKSSKCLS